MPDSVVTEDYGKHVIKSALLKNVWTARAFRGYIVVTTQSGLNRDAAIAQVKLELARIGDKELSEQSSDGAPPSRVYLGAFQRLDQFFPESYRAMLRAHLQADDYMISANRLAKAANFDNWSAANLHYGKLARRVAEDIGYEPPERENGTPIWTYAIAKAPDADADNLDQAQLYAALERHLEAPHFEWLLRPQVVEALKSLGY
ncbi:hypothetical protein [Sphingobium sp. D43FB]|uniref:hypothetical protein n=1 Tax=Sphingobium sp. D43FB TaxID=2017595 RepID=UPI001142F5A4|nr:hypothetical protein [Sphingobium sp. D43FB]